MVDGGSVDGSVEIIRRYEDRLHAWISEPDEGQYDAVRKGFELAPAGEIMAWLNADDLYFPWALRTVASIVSELPEVRVPWGNTTNGSWIQQESTFWTHELWETAGAHLDLEFGLAADFALWCRLYDHAQLYATPALLGGSRRHGEHRRSDDHVRYRSEAVEALSRMRGRAGWRRSLALDAARQLRLARFPRIGAVVGRRLGYEAGWVIRAAGNWRIDRPRFLDRNAFESFG